MHGGNTTKKGEQQRLPNDEEADNPQRRTGAWDSKPRAVNKVFGGFYSSRRRNTLDSERRDDA